MGPVSPLTDGTNVAAGAVGGLPLTSNNLPVNAGGTGGIPVSTPDGQQVTTQDGDPIIVGGIGGKPVTGGGVGGSPLLVGDKPIVVNGEGGEGLVAGAFPVVIGAPVATQQTGAGGVGGGTGAGAGDNNTSLVTAVPEVSADTEDGAKTGAITSIGPYASTEFIIVQDELSNDEKDF